MKKLIAVLLVLSLITVLAVACGGSGGSTNVHLGSSTFLQPSVTISKGDSINLIDDMAVVHIISNGSWMNGVPQPVTESGAPTASNLQFSTAGQSQMIGPFNTAGTYHFFCSVHPGMNLTVIVQ